MATSNPVCVWDFTVSKEHTDLTKLTDLCKLHAKAWAFQLERGASGYEHFQGRVSLKVKSRMPKWSNDKIHWSATSGANRDNDFYVMKEDTRIMGPWTDKDEEVYIPRQYRELELYPWQQTIKDSAERFEPRKINLIYDPVGGNGKSTIASICELLHGGIDMPPLNDYKELVALACNICMDKNLRNPKIMFFDMPRAIRKDQLYGLYSAIEQIKKGKLYDCRYHYKCWWIDAPQIWVFSNAEPDRTLLSADRWVLWHIRNGTLVPGVPAQNDAAQNTPVTQGGSNGATL